MNYEKIVAELCINRDRPELNCNGVCYLHNEVSKTVENEQKEKIPTSVKSIDFFVYQSTLQIKEPLLEHSTKIKYQLKKEDLPQFQLSELLHPPIV